jgi:site-specific recombinase XerD
LTLEDLHVDAILTFLVQLESQRANKVVTRNCRLTAIRGFFRHLIRHDPTRAEQYHRVLSLPSKKARHAVATYLEPEEVRMILNQPDRRTPLGIRDHTLLLCLYNTGARVSEVLSLRMEDVRLTPPAHVRLHGKGRKDRLCPLWRDTALSLRRLDSIRPAHPGHPLFLNARGDPLTRDGVAYVLRKYVAAAAREAPTLRRRRVTPHVLRHSCAVALLQGGVDVTVIRDYLGHASITTTSRYITTNLQMKRDALEAFWSQAGISPEKTTHWKPKPDLLAFLDSL